MNSKPRPHSEILVSFRGVFENFRRAPPSFSYASTPPGGGGRIRDRFQIDAFSPFSTVYTTKKTYRFENAPLLKAFTKRRGFKIGLDRCRANQNLMHHFTPGYKWIPVNLLLEVSL